MQLSIDNWPAFVLSLLAAFGGWAVVVGGLLYFLADLFAKRTLQRESSVLSHQLAGLTHELSLQKSSYEKHLELLLDYYQSFYRHYRACQRAATADAVRRPDGTTTKTKDEFFLELEEYLADNASKEGRLRLVLPAHILTIHAEAQDAFNAFKDVMGMKDYDEAFHRGKDQTFRTIHEVKERLEMALRDFVRTEHLLRISHGES
jgi:hypothetical protein